MFRVNLYTTSNLLKSNKCQQVKKQYCNIRLKFIKNTNKYGIYTK